MLDIKKKLFLIPSTIGDTPVSQVIPAYNLDVIRNLRHFVVEEERTARRFLIRCGHKQFLDDIHFYLLNEHTLPNDIPFMFIDSGNEDIGLISEAGVPGVADPGALLVEEAHKTAIRVVPLTGPSSLILALMASGLNGQQFSFNGYLPVKSPERTDRIRFYEKRSESENQTQLFIEAPYRNVQLTEALLATLKPGTRLCIAVNISLSEEWIRTKTVREWRNTALPDLKRQPAVFIFQA
jgi:16S rRNA (cytidine1402-2'-O)-methyltransferase